jgi:hypothetical protein
VMTSLLDLSKPLVVFCPFGMIAAAARGRLHVTGVFAEWLTVEMLAVSLHSIVLAVIGMLRLPMIRRISLLWVFVLHFYTYYLNLCKFLNKRFRHQ